jgi:hypothetical protein
MRGIRDEGNPDASVFRLIRSTGCWAMQFVLVGGYGTKRDARRVELQPVRGEIEGASPGYLKYNYCAF